MPAGIRRPGKPRDRRWRHAGEAGALPDDPALRGRPRDFQVTVRNIQVNSGAGFLVVLTGEIMRMPGLPKKPLAESVRFNPDGTVEGLG